MPRTGDRLAGRYELIAPIGSGGFATVFRARDLWLGRDVAAKILLPNHSGDAVVAARFGREARALAAISHPNVVAIHDVGGGDPATGSEPFLVMDLCADGSLADRLADSDLGALPPEELIPILADAAAGLAALHALGIVHRDIKPSNILLGDGRARIADLGIALSEPSELTAPQTTVGTLAYLAPELLAGGPASPASDVYALGVVAYLGLTGVLPRPARNLAEVVASSRAPTPVVSSLAPAVGPALDGPIAAALARSAGARPTAAAFGTAIRSALAAGSGTSVTTPSAVSAPFVERHAADAPTLTDLPLPSATRPAGRISVLATIAVIALAVAIGGLSLAAIGGFGPLLGSAGSPGPSSEAIAGAPSPSATLATTTPAPTPTPSPTPTPTPTPTPSRRRHRRRRRTRSKPRQPAGPSPGPPSRTPRIRAS